MTPWMRTIAAEAVFFGIQVIKRIFFFPEASCRFVPSCSWFAREALLKLPFGTAVRLIVLRIMRCHPFGGSGHDPVPVQEKSGASE